MEYELKESARARHLRITVHPDGRVVVTKPRRVSAAVAERFLAERREWVEKAREAFRKRMERERKVGIERILLPKPRRGSKAYKEAVEKARALAKARLTHFNAAYGFRHGTISIRNQKTRWGSCSAAGNLSFNYRIAFLPPRLADYVIVHELCHVKEHNHSERFWSEVARSVPEYKALRKELRERYR